MGDFNAYTNTMDDSPDYDDSVAEYSGCDSLLSSNKVEINKIHPAFTQYRYNQDLNNVNKNGRQLISMCRALEFTVVNGRLGADKYLGNPTCYKGSPSVIDYVLVNVDMLPYLCAFDIDMYDECLSDVHCPLRFVLNAKSDLMSSEMKSNNSINEENESTSGTATTSMFFDWSSEIAAEYHAHISNESISQLSENLLSMSTNVSQENIDNLCHELNGIFINAAKEVGACKERNYKNNNNNKSSKKNFSQPWFDNNCKEERRKYFKCKNYLKRKGKKSMCNKETKKYKKFIKEKERSYYKTLKHKLRTLRSENSKDYWNLLNKVHGNKSKLTVPSMNFFMDHFRKLSQSHNEETVNYPLHIVDDIQENSDLNKNFSINEIQSNIKNLKNNKACGIDNIRNEFLKYAPAPLIKFICDLFNIILNTGFIPDVWCKGLIMPLYKMKGDSKDPNNYRGITLLSCLGKLFTSCLNSRLTSFLYKDPIIGYEQAGFRPEFSTIDHIFTLHAIIEYYKCKKGRVYCAFVDYKKAFDLVDRSLLWMKVLKSGISGKIFNVIFNIYANAKSCVRSDNKLSSFFSCNIGVRQGENMSPILFAIYLNDFQESLCKFYKGLESLTDDIQNELEVFMKMYVLLYADDTIILAETATELQNSLYGLASYCSKWSLQVNIDKTKIVIFSRGKVKKIPKFFLGTEEIKVCDDYIYLGIKFNYNGLFTKAIEKQIDQARKAMFIVLEKARKLQLPIDIILELFDKCVVPILLYGSEVWGWSNLRELEIFHRSFLRLIFRTYKFTPNCMLYGESGATDMETKIKQRMVNFWAKINFKNSDRIS